MYKITVVGIGYVGASISALLAKHNDVICLDIDKKKIDAINNLVSPIQDHDIQHYFDKEKLNIRATANKKDAYKNADFIIICAPTDFDDSTEKFDTNILETIIKDTQEVCNDSLLVIKSTVPIGFTLKMKKLYKSENIIFSPEFLREGKALHDNLFPSRIVIGSESNKAVLFGSLLKDASNDENAEVFYMSSDEAEAVKLFANTYLAMRVSFFNELDNYAMHSNLNAANIIKAVSMDSRIGNYYNNPSFGYGGYCLPKDSKQLLSSFKQVPQKLIQAIIDSNKLRKDFIVDEIMKLKINTVGIYRLSMKKNSDNFRTSSTIDLIEKLNNNNVDMLIYEPNYDYDSYNGIRVERDLESFKSFSDLIVANRTEDELKDVKAKIFTRDIFKKD